ncbi:hypothetical protein SAMN05421541_10355 [Actinoplanes philippinensis]|uniref:Uncharacterized protein n=1 Tax=Actinoplanes philippinensis TaxID=35752 RepID=A0A1I2CKL3_9ACTN|nr:hypothetical protein SAMN05421541_10355 [Actinoplanes philippinensis]
MLASADHGGVDQEDFDRLCRRVYSEVRAGALEYPDMFDLATAVLEVKPSDRDAAELATLSLDGVAVNWPRMMELGDAVLATACFELGLSEEPAQMAGLDDAMRLVNRDLSATGLPGCRLRFMDFDPDLDENRFVETWDGEFGTGSGVPSIAVADPVSALVAVAEDAQDAVMHTIWTAWPVCPAHRLGAHARRYREAAVWWCTGDGGHVAASVGHLPPGASRV